MDDLDSSSKGIWVLPYDPQEPGPSRSPDRRPLNSLYERSFKAYRDAHEAYETRRTEEQLDDIAEWLERSSKPVSTEVIFHRLPLAVLQHTGEGLHKMLAEAAERMEVVGVQGRDLVDVAAAVRCCTTQLIGDMSSKSGMTGLDQIERWWRTRKDAPSILLHIQDAQIVPPNILTELMYILTLHPELPFRLLLSVSSVRTFLSQWTPVEPSSIDLTVLSSLRSKRKVNPVSIILENAGLSHAGDGQLGLEAGDDLAGQLRRDEAMFGEGPRAALRSLQWVMLHHQANSPLSTLLQDQDPADLGRLLAILEQAKEDAAADVPGKKALLDLPSTPDLIHVTDPSPRISILHALANSASFRRDLPAAVSTTVGDATSTPKKAIAKGRRGKGKEMLPRSEGTESNGAGAGGGDNLSRDAYGDLKELEVLYNLWKGAGKSVNLWDWLQGYQASVLGDDDEGDGDENQEGIEPMGTESQSRKRRRVDDGEEDRVHASFVRFCEEARMMGLVRARGKGVRRRADEVVKGVTLV